MPPCPAGDRWSSALDGLKSHDLQYWQPLAFSGDSGAGAARPPAIAALEWRDWFELDV